MQTTSYHWAGELFILYKMSNLKFQVAFLEVEIYGKVADTVSPQKRFGCFYNKGQESCEVLYDMEFDESSVLSGTQNDFKSVLAETRVGFLQSGDNHCWHWVQEEMRAPWGGLVKGERQPHLLSTPIYMRSPFLPHMFHPSNQLPRAWSNISVWVNSEFVDHFLVFLIFWYTHTHESTVLESCSFGITPTSYSFCCCIGKMVCSIDP